MTAVTLARLVAEAEEEGGDLVTLRAIVEEASEMGAARALDKLGLSDEAAQADMRELRALLSAWRDVRKSAWRAAVGWLVKGLLALILIGLSLRLGLQQVSS